MILLGLGSNLGDRKKNLRNALEILTSEDMVILQSSHFYETAPWGKTDQNPFFNCVVLVDFKGDPRELLSLVLATELRMGRFRAEKWGPRLIDIDVLEFNHQSVAEPGLTLPHPLMLQRAFVLVPLAEIVPDFVPTGQTKTAKQLLLNFKPEELSGIIKN